MFTKTRSLVVGLLVLAFATLFFAQEALATWTICNKTNGTVWVARAFQVMVNAIKKGTFVSQGWLELKSSECNKVLDENVKGWHLYFYAETKGRDLTWPGDYYFCINGKNAFALFDADSESRCSGTDLEWQGFMEQVASTDNWTTNLTP